MQCIARVIKRVLKRLEEAGDTRQNTEEIREIVKHQFKLLVDGRFVQRAVPVALELEGKTTDDRERSTTPVVDNRFVLPPSVDSECAW